MSTTGFIVRLVRSQGREVPAVVFTVDGGTALVGRDPECEVPLPDDKSVSRRHARIERARDGRFRVVDLDSANGVWIESRRIVDEQLEAGQQFRVGESILVCRSRPVGEQTDFDRTRPLPAHGEWAPAAGRPGLANAGEPFAVGERSATLLDEPACAYYVSAGALDVFTVTIEDGRAIEGRSHLASIKAGGAVFGVDPRQPHGTLLMATGTAATAVRRIPAAELERLAGQPEGAPAIAAMVDHWLIAASAYLTSDLPARPEVGIALQAGVRSLLAPGQRARPVAGVLWVPVERQDLSFIGMGTLPAASQTMHLPITPDTWVALEKADAGELAIEPRDTSALLASGQLWASLQYVQEVIGAGVATAQRRSARRESERLGHKAREAEAARDVAFDVLGDVLLDQARDAPATVAAGALAPILEACRLAGASLGIDVRAPGDLPGELTFEEHVAAIAAASGFRTRVVALRADWWRTDAGALVGHTAEGAAVALLPRGSRAYVAVDVASGTEHKVTPAYAATLAPFAVTLYRPLPAGTPGPFDLLRFGTRGLAPDLWMVVGAGLLVSFLGALVQLLTGQMIDRAIPQGEEALLLQLGLGMLILTLASTALSVVKSVAVVRMESRVDAALQSAVWIRLLALPAGFFRRYGAGDLAERAAGIDAIRRVLSTSGISSILGLVNAIAYLGLMVYLSPALAAVAVVITLGLVAFSTLGNYLLLRTQRQEVDLRGQIASLMLQLIAGVAKVRMSGAENHAFRVWAQRFAEQKRLSFSLGRLENVLITLGSGFQVLAPLAIFAAIYRLQSGDGAAGPALTTGDFVAFYAAFGIFSAAMADLCSVSLSLLVIVPFFERLQPILGAAAENDRAKPHPGRLKGEVGVSHVHFRYRADGPWVLKDVSFSIRPGEFVALVGPSGCGKSTLLRLLLGFEQPGSGSVHYDGVDMAELDARALRKQIGVVLQESRLMPTDIYRNIVGDSSRTISDAWAAAELAGLADDIRRMPMGLHTMVSEGGGTFSGGQSQRLLIARALVAKPRIIFFDEATSALDNRAQAIVTDSLDRLDCTRVVIAHRLSTLVDADRIIYLDDGQIQEQGTYAELMAKGGLFAQLARRQMA